MVVLTDDTGAIALAVGVGVVALTAGKDAVSLALAGGVGRPKWERLKNYNWKRKTTADKGQENTSNKKYGKRQTASQARGKI